MRLTSTRSSPPRAARARRSSPPTAPASATSRARSCARRSASARSRSSCSRRRSRSRTSTSTSTRGRLRRDRPRRGREHRGRARSSRAPRPSPSSSSATSTSPTPRTTIKRKIIEAEMAMQYEDEYTKDQILKRYLNTASYGTNDGRTAVGVEAASQVFFSRNVEDIGLRQAALLAGLPQAPSDYNPFTNPKGAKHRRNEVLDAMAEQGYITLAEAEHEKGALARAGARPQVRVAQPAVLLRLRPAGADRHLRARDGTRGRPQGLYDPRPPPPAGRRGRDRGPPGHRRRRGARVDRRRHRRDPRDGVVRVL